MTKRKGSQHGSRMNARYVHCCISSCSGDLAEIGPVLPSAEPRRRIGYYRNMPRTRKKEATRITYNPPNQPGADTTGRIIPYIV